MPRRYRFKGSAYGAAGVLTTPFQEVIHTQASANLADVGGYASGRSENFNHRDIVRFDLAHTEVTGSRTHRDRPGETYQTLVRSTIDGFDMMGMVTADRIVANLVSTYNAAAHEEPSVKLIGSRFENLRIAGIPVKVCLNLDVLDKYHYHQTFRDSFATEQCVRDLFGGDEVKRRYADAPSEVKEFLDEPPGDGDGLPNYDGVSTVSIVRKLEPECNAFECFGHVIHIEGFGTIRLGEVSISKKCRTLSMVQVRFGCPVDGSGNGGVVQGGGST